MPSVFAVLFVKLIVTFVSLVLSIICLFWLLRVKKNAKDEPDNRLRYYFFEYSEIVCPNFYTPDEFCYNHYKTFIDKSVFEDFYIHMKKIETFSLALLILLVLSLLGKFIRMKLDLMNLFVINCCIRIDKSYKILQTISQIINSLALILSLIFFILISFFYFDSNFDDFDEFSHCEYLNSRFDKDYDFVNVVKKNYLRTFIGYILVLFLDFSHLIIMIVFHSCFKIEKKLLNIFIKINNLLKNIKYNY